MGEQNEKENVKRVIESLSEFLFDVAKMLESYAEYEKAIKEFLGTDVNALDIGKLLQNEEFKERIKSTDPAILGRLMILLLDFADITAKTKKLNELSPEDKIELSERIKRFAEEIKKLAEEGI